MTQEIVTESMWNDVDLSAPPPSLTLSRSFSTYGSTDTMAVEQWFYFGGTQPSDEAIQNGFPVLYNQIYSEDTNGQCYWTCNFYFTDAQKQRWAVLETIAGCKPIMDKYQLIHDMSGAPTPDKQ